MNLRELREEHKSLMVKSEQIRMKYQGDKYNDMTATEETEWRNILDTADSLQSKIDLLEREAKSQAWSNEISNRLPLPGSKDLGMAGEGDIAARNAFRKFLMGGYKSISDADMKAIALSTSTKAYQADNPAGGAFLVTPQQFVTDVLTLMKDLVFVRQYATIYTVIRAESLGIPAIDTDPSDADWTTELGTGTEETTMAFGKRELKPTPIAKRIKLSNKLIRSGAMNVESIVQDRLAYKFAITEEKAFLTGAGNAQPLGLFTASSDGIGTGRDVTAASATAIAGDDLIEVQYTIKPQYRANAKWIMNRSVIKAVRKLKDTTGNYLWASGTPIATVSLDGLGPGGGLQGTPDTLLGSPVLVSEYAPGTITTGLYTAVYGDLSKYYIADALDWQLQVLDQLYAEANQTGYIGRKETDGMPVLAEAFARLKQA